MQMGTGTTYSTSLNVEAKGFEQADTYLESVVCRLEALVSGLENQLRVVLIETEEKQNDVAKSVPSELDPHSPLYNILVAKTDRLDFIADRLSSISSRLDL